MFDKTRQKIETQINDRVTSPVRTGIIISVTALIISAIALVIAVNR